MESSGDGSIGLVNAWQVNLGVELHGWWLLWVGFAANDFHHVNAVIKVCVWWPNDGTVPVSKRFVITIGETVRHALVTKLSMLSFFQLLIESESSWHYISKNY